MNPEQHEPPSSRLAGHPAARANGHPGSQANGHPGSQANGDRPGPDGELVGKVLRSAASGSVSPPLPAAGLMLVPTAQEGAGDREARLAMIAYLSVPFFGFAVPLVIYLANLRRSWLRAHAAQALNVWLTALVYAVSAAIMGTMLALDTVAVAIAVALPALCALWLVTLIFLLRAGARASRGEEYTFPRWLCSRFAR